MNGQANCNTGVAAERVFRSHDRSTISVPELAAMQRGYLERLGTIVEQLTTIMRQPDTLNEPAGEVPLNGYTCAHDIKPGVPLEALVRRTLPSGAVAYGMPTNLLRWIVAKFAGGNRIAFVHDRPESRSASIEIVGKNDRPIAAAMNFAAKCWGTEEVIIHVDGKDARRFIEHAVAQKLNVAICDPYIESLVTAASQCHAVRSQKADAPRSVAVLEHVPADGSSQ